MTERDPERLRVVGATDLEQRLLAAAAAETPSPEQTRRMAAALGLTVGAGLSAASSSAGASVGLAWPLVSIGVAALGLAGAAVGWSRTHRAAAAPAVQVAAPPLPVVTKPAAPALEPPPPAPRARHRHAGAATPAAADLRVEIGLLDAARAALSDGDDTRALALLRRYDAAFPSGAFRPESAALQIETLAHLGEAERARAMGRAFIAAHPDSPLVGRVQRAMR